MTSDFQTDTSFSKSLAFLVNCRTLFRSLSKSAVNSLFFLESSIILPAAVSAATPVPKNLIYQIQHC